MKTKRNKIFRFGLFVTALLAIQSANAELTYQTNIPLCKTEKERCHGKLVSVSDSGIHGIYLVEGAAFNGNVFGELVNLQTNTSINYFGDPQSQVGMQSGLSDKNLDGVRNNFQFPT